MKRWFGKSLAFSCTACGKCCKGRTNVYLNGAETEAMAEALDCSLFDFYKKYTREEENKKGELLISLKTKQDNTTKELSCIMLNDKNQCSIYNARPTQCRTYPFWPQNLVGESEWRAEASKCEGMRVSNVEDVPRGVPREVPRRVPSTEILSNLVVKMVHDKGTGPNW